MKSLKEIIKGKKFMPTLLIYLVMLNIITLIVLLYTLEHLRFFLSIEFESQCQLYWLGKDVQLYSWENITEYTPNISIRINEEVDLRPYAYQK